jgi:hypothetical protein
LEVEDDEDLGLAAKALKQIKKNLPQRPPTAKKGP